MADLENKSIKQIEAFTAMHTDLVADGRGLAARKTRYALGSLFDSILESMAEADGGKGARAPATAEDDGQQEVPLGEGEPEGEPVAVGADGEDIF